MVEFFGNQTISLIGGASIKLDSLVGAAVSVVIGLILAEVVYRWILALSKSTKYVWIFNEDTGKLLRNFIIIGSLLSAFDTLGLLSITVFGSTLSKIIAGFLLFYISYLIGKKVQDYWLIREGAEAQIKAKIFYYTLVTLAFFLALNIAGFSGRLTTVIAAAGITGIVLGFSAQTVIANFISGIFMYFDKPLKIGDPVEVGGYSGIVHDIRILSTRIRTWDGLLVRIPNEKVFNSEIKNLAKYPARRVDVIVGIAYREDIERVIRIIREILDDMPYVLAEPEPSIFVDELGDSSVNIAVRAWAPSEKWFDVRTQILQRIKEALDEKGIEIPFPQRVNWFAEELRVKLEH
ncbi:mechanosensitive ion channel protein MscS [Thermococcus chitonophagus]|uniref:Mechanosensitive ion channel protein MscS n=1 Tax=Thermococcus chitonophagus TaxID=54262 RepID=A0A160VVT5_9EURY|nr:mechanosensitive ion channel family protein [Thermococcus chitonophagus]ASJ17310.1 mechanosensitive ion channel protein MscS [Thermococcus chitonophagus]CUX77941.1 Small-conductance mechanosensitive channel [Thermococcus chitonophagus]